MTFYHFLRPLWPSMIVKPKSSPKSKIQSPEERDWDWGLHYNPTGHTPHTRLKRAYNLKSCPEQWYTTYWRGPLGVLKKHFAQFWELNFEALEANGGSTISLVFLIYSGFSTWRRGYTSPRGMASRELSKYFAKPGPASTSRMRWGRVYSFVMERVLRIGVLC